MVLNTAVQWELIRQNPAAKVKSPKKTVKPKPVWTVAQTQDFIICCQTQVIKWEPLFLVALNTGLRIGKLLGLQWSNVDYQRKTLKVQRSLAELPPKQFVVQTPKSKSSIRTITLSTVTGNRLLNIKLQQQSVLYIDYESDEGSIQERLNEIIDGSKPHSYDSLFFDTEWPTIKAGGLVALNEALITMFIRYGL